MILLLRKFVSHSSEILHYFICISRGSFTINKCKDCCKITNLIFKSVKYVVIPTKYGFINVSSFKELNSVLLISNNELSIKHFSSILRFLPCFSLPKSGFSFAQSETQDMRPPLPAEPRLGHLNESIFGLCKCRMCCTPNTIFHSFIFPRAYSRRHLRSHALRILRPTSTTVII